jgi:hypothetical protein
MRYAIWFRKQIEVNTDPQRRCYDGCHFSSRLEWTEWARVCGYRTEEDANRSVRTFKSINPSFEYEVRPDNHV